VSAVPQGDRSAGTSYWVLIIDRPTSGLDSEIRLHLSARPAVDVMSGQGLGERDGSALGYRATYPQLSHSMNARPYLWRLRGELEINLLQRDLN
jgi:hypothetical protein